MEHRKKEERKKEIKRQGDNQPKCPLQEQTVQNHRHDSKLYLMSHILKSNREKKEKNNNKKTTLSSKIEKLPPSLLSLFKTFTIVAWSQTAWICPVFL